jgi:hypothetical protein
VTLLGDARRRSLGAGDGAVPHALVRPAALRAITVQQPWAWAIIHGGKNVENRTRIGTWRRAVGTTVAIHASQRWSDRGADSPLVVTSWSRACRLPFEVRPISTGDEFLFGVIIGLVDVVDVHLEEGGCCAPWGEQSYVEAGGSKRVDIVHLSLEHPRPVEPIDCRGALGLWTVQVDVAAAVGGAS